MMDMKRPWGSFPILFQDTETSGLCALGDDIVEYAAALFVGGEVTTTYSTLIRPRSPMGEEIQKIHGITNEMVEAEGISAAEAVWEIEQLLRAHEEDGLVGAYNAPFDRAFLRSFWARWLSPLYAKAQAPAALATTGAAWVDPLVWVRKAFKYASGAGRHKLSNVAPLLGLQQEGSFHRALFDAVTAGRVLYTLAKRAECPHGLKPGTPLEDMLSWQAIYAAEHEADFQRHLMKKRKVSS